MATDVLTVKVEFDKENAMNCIKNVLMDEYGMTLDELAKLCKAKQKGRLREDVRGEWVLENTREKSYMRVCSVCKRIAYSCTPVFSYCFCPNCGARMTGGGKR